MNGRSWNIDHDRIEKFMDVLVREDIFHFKKFDVHQDQCMMKVCTDGVLLGSWVRLEHVKTGLDIGTGSGVITLMLAQRSEHINSILGIEIDERSYHQACANAAQSEWCERLKMIHAPVQDYMYETQDTFDLIVSNPPFFTGGTLSESQPRNDVRHTVKLPHGDLLRAVKKLLNSKGRFAVILPVMEGYRFVELAEQYRLYLIRQTEVLSRPDKPIERLLMEFSNQDKKRVESDRLIIHEESGPGFTPEYRKLTGDFYLNF